MSFREIELSEKAVYNQSVSHPLQSWEWGEFRKKTGVTVIRRGKFEGKKLIDAFQLTIHPLPKLPFTIGYIPKGNLPTAEMLAELETIGKKYKCIFIKLEPNVEKHVGADLCVRPEARSKEQELKIGKYALPQSPHPLFTKYTFELDLTKSEDELMQQMNQKTRYNVKLAQRRGVEVQEDTSEKAFKEYLRLTFETTKRQGFFAHDEGYHRLMWEIIGRTHRSAPTELTAHLLTAKYQTKVLVTWIVFLFNNVLYYPYGASSNEHRELMASNLMMWEAIKWGKAHGAKRFDLWGSLGPNPDSNDPWYGFHRFKEGYNPRLVEFVGSYDLVLNPILYRLYTIMHHVRWLLLRLKFSGLS